MSQLNATKIVAYTKDDATPAEKKAMKDAVDKVESIKMTGYAISNLANKSYIMQNWTGETLNIPSGITYYQPTTEFGTATALRTETTSLQQLLLIIIRIMYLRTTMRMQQLQCTSNIL